MSDKKRECDECHTMCIEDDMWIVREPVDEVRVEQAFCCQTCLMAYYGMELRGVE